MKIVNVPSFEHLEIAGDPVDARGVILPSCFDSQTAPLVVDHSTGETNGPLRKLSSAHGRSYLVDTQDTQGPWIDGFGNLHTVLSTKGNNLTEPGFVRSPTASANFLPHGLQEGNSLLRILRASHIMRQVGIDTERPLKILEPQNLIFGGEEVDVDKYKALLIEAMLEQVRTGGEQVEKANPFTYEEISDAALILKGLSFFVTLRATSTAARIGDLIEGGKLFLGVPIDVSINESELSQVFQAYNASAEHRSSDFRSLGFAEQLPETVNEDTDRDALEHYFAEILPKSVALNLSRLHNLGLVHGFPHAHNFTALGGIVDLDSVKGEPLDLGDKMHGVQQTLEDSAQAAQSIFERIGYLRSHELEWLQLARYSRDNFTATYHELLDSPLSEKDRAKHIFITSGIHPSSLHRQIHSALDLEAIKKFYPHAEETLSVAEARGKQCLLQNPVIIPARELATILFEQTTSASSAIWGEFDKDSTDEDGNLLFNQGKPPTDEQLIKALPDSVEANKAEGQLFARAIFDVNIKHTLRLKFHKELMPALSVAAEAFLNHLLPDETFNTEEVNSFFISVLDELQVRLAEQVTLPEYDEFWEEMKMVFKERYLDSFDRSLIPGEALINGDEKFLEQFVAFWTHDCRFGEVLMRACSKVPAPEIEKMIDPSTPVQTVSTGDEVLQIKPEKKESVRLLITDGDINSEINYEECLIKGKEGADYIQFMREDGRSHGATQAIFVLQNENEFRTIYKKIATSK